MQKQEFEERIERTVTDEQYKVIEEDKDYIKEPVIGWNRWVCRL